MTEKKEDSVKIVKEPEISEPSASSSLDQDSLSISDVDDFTPEQVKINEFIAKLAKLWRSYPDQRLGQLLTNVTATGTGVLWDTETVVFERGILRALEGEWHAGY